MEEISDRKRSQLFSMKEALYLTEWISSKGVLDWIVVIDECFFLHIYLLALLQSNNTSIWWPVILITYDIIISSRVHKGPPDCGHTLHLITVNNGYVQYSSINLQWAYVTHSRTANTRENSETSLTNFHTIFLRKIYEPTALMQRRIFLLLGNRRTEAVWVEEFRGQGVVSCWKISHNLKSLLRPSSFDWQDRRGTPKRTYLHFG
jgi:hypothetical protein